MHHNLFNSTEERRSAVDVVIDKVKTLLIEKKLKPGDLIPNETQLAEHLHVSRGSIREAMKILSAYGIIEIRRGAGTYISRSSNQKLFDPLLFSILVNSTDYHELIEVRDMMEKEVVKLFIQNARDDDYQFLQDIMDRFEETMINPALTQEEKNIKGNALDLEYHISLGKMTNNTILEKMYHFIVEMFKPTINATGGYGAHRKMHDAIIARDIELAVAMVEHHTLTWKTCWEKKSL